MEEKDTILYISVIFFYKTYRYILWLLCRSVLTITIGGDLIKSFFIRIL